MKLFEHLILIRFSVKFEERWEFQNKKNKLFEPLRLEKRLELFEKFCLKGIINQTLKDFKVILLVDKNLPEIYKNKIESLVSSYEYIIIHEWNLEDRLNNNNWLRKYCEECRFLITTRLDDDDIINKNINQVFKDYIKVKLIRKLVDQCISFRGGRFIQNTNDNYKIFPSRYKTAGIFLSYLTKSDFDKNIYNVEHDSINKKVRILKLPNCWGILNHEFENDNRYYRYSKKKMEEITLEKIYEIYI